MEQGMLENSVVFKKEILLLAVLIGNLFAMDLSVDGAVLGTIPTPMFPGDTLQA